MNTFERRLLQMKPLKWGEYQGYEVRYMKSDAMDSFFGYAFDNKIFVQGKLSERVQEFVISHEQYHLTDKHRWWGWAGAELRANAVCALRNPIGFLATVRASMTRSRITTYLSLVKRRGCIEDSAVNRLNKA